MNRVEFTARLVGLLRAEKNPPLARYAVVMAAASAGPAGATTRQIGEILMDPNPQSGSLVQKVAEGGWIRQVNPGLKPAHWTPTGKGLAIVARLTSAQNAELKP